MALSCAAVGRPFVSMMTRTKDDGLFVSPPAWPGMEVFVCEPLVLPVKSSGASLLLLPVLLVGVCALTFAAVAIGARVTSKRQSVLKQAVVRRNILVSLLSRCAVCCSCARPKARGEQ